MSCGNGMDFFPANFMLQNPHEDDHHHQPPSSLNPLLSQDFHGVASFLGKRSTMSFSNIDGCVEEGNLNGEEDLSDDGSQAGEKKRRLNMEQVKTLEKNFELGNKLEPERKIQLARALGLQPRQVAIWFQNRRARWKTKQLEKDYDVLKKQFDAVKADNDVLQAQNQKLHAEILALKNREPTESINLNKETEGSSSNRSTETSTDTKLDISRTPPEIDSPLAACAGAGAGATNTTTTPTTSIPFFPSSSSLTMRPTAVTTQFFSSTTTPTTKMDQLVKEESLSNMFCTIDDQSGFWPWLEHQHFN